MRGLTAPAEDRDRHGPWVEQSRGQATIVLTLAIIAQGLSSDAPEMLVAMTRGQFVLARSVWLSSPIQYRPAPIVGQGGRQEAAGFRLQETQPNAAVWTACLIHRLALPMATGRSWPGRIPIPGARHATHAKPKRRTVNNNGRTAHADFIAIGTGFDDRPRHAFPEAAHGHAPHRPRPIDDLSPGCHSELPHTRQTGCTRSGLASWRHRGLEPDANYINALTLQDRYGLSVCTRWRIDRPRPIRHAAHWAPSKRNSQPIAISTRAGLPQRQVVKR